MCKLVSAFPICCKLISRLSLLSLVLKRLVGSLFTCDLVSSDSPDDSVTMDTSSADADVNIIRPRPFSGTRTKSKRSTTQHRAKQTTNIGRKLTRILRGLFEWPFVSMLIALIWIVAIVASWPLFSSYIVRDGVCDSEYRFPEDIRAVQSLWFSYLIFGTLTQSPVNTNRLEYF